MHNQMRQISLFIEDNQHIDYAVKFFRLKTSWFTSWTAIFLEHFYYIGFTEMLDTPVT